MSHILEDRVLETTTSTGVGVITLAAAVTGFRRFNAVCAIGDTVPYFIEALDSLGVPSGEYEYGIGTYTAANQITRTTVMGSSNAGAAVNFAAGSKNVGITVLAGALQYGSNANGQWMKHPNGVIEQWGTLTTPAGGNQVVTFPIPFPTACQGVQATIAAVDGTPNGIGLSSVGTANFTVGTYASATGVGKALPVAWSAKGR